MSVKALKVRRGALVRYTDAYLKSIEAEGHARDMGRVVGTFEFREHRPLLVVEWERSGGIMAMPADNIEEVQDASQCQ